MIDNAVGRFRRRPGQVDGRVVEFVKGETVRGRGKVLGRQDVEDVGLCAIDTGGPGYLSHDQRRHEYRVVGVRANVNEVDLRRPYGQQICFILKKTDIFFNR